MVLGLSSKNRRGTSSIQVDYQIHIHEIKPWPPSQSLRSLRSVVIQWENGDRNSGTTNVVAPSLGSVIGEGKIEFNESFKLPVTLLKDVSSRNKTGDVFFKNVLEFNLYEPRREKTHQLLATATIDLADYGIVKESFSLTASMNSKRSYRNTTQPVLYLTIQPIDKRRASSSSRNSFKDDATKGGESVSALMNEEYYKEAEIASITDDDISSHSSLTVSSSTLESNGGFSVRTEEEEHERVNKNAKGSRHERSQSASESRQGEIPNKIPSRSASVDLSSVFNNVPVDIPDSAPNTSVPGMDDCANVFITDTNESSKLVTSNSEETKSVPFQIDDHSGNASPRASENSQDLISDQESESRVEKSRKVKSVRSSTDISRSNSRLSLSSERKEAKVYPNSTQDTTLESKVKNLESKVKKLEGELREAAAIEAALYSVVAEHGSSSSKVHAPARRLLRLYLHACKENHLSRRANAAKSAVSGLVLVAKACGNDVPRLTFWLSNTIVLRAIVSDTNGEEELPVSAGPGPRRHNTEREETEKRSSLRWKESSLSKKGIESFGAWDDPITFITALEKVEAWIFSRVVESIWWQILTPRMQSSAAASTREFDNANGSVSKKNFGRTPNSMNQVQGDFSLELWKKAFREAHERLCPLRASGHECGCLSVPACLIMEHCVARLDVAMFNAILRDSDENFPTDPVSDPIADSRVLPIPCTTSSFGSGAQLKNSIGNWSRWLTDLFGIDDEDGGSSDDENSYVDRSFKTFNLLKALSDLMMLPKDMLLNSSVRKEVCPMFGALLIKRVLDNFVPDEFCPDPVPDAVFEALETEEEAEKAMITSYPCTAPPPVYTPPSGSSISTIIGDFGQPQSPQLCRIRSSVTRKAYTSDDELDELSSPLTVVVLQQAGSKKVNNGGADETVRYELLREFWTDGE